MNHTLCFFLIGLLVSTFCSGPVGNSTVQKEAFDQTSPQSVILEVVTTATGATYPKEGDILQMRLLENGQFSFDDFPDYDPPRATGRNVSISRKEAKLPEADVKALIMLAESPDFLAAKDKYELVRPHLDDRWVTKITYRRGTINKSITAVNIWDAQYSPELKGHYPASVLTLLEQVERMKGKAIGRVSYQWLAKPKSNK